MNRPRPVDELSRAERRHLLKREEKRRRTGQWGPWETLTVPAGSMGRSGWGATVTTVHRNGVFSVLDRMDFSGARHLSISSLTGTRPTWWEMQRIKNDLAGEEATAVEVYPPQQEVVDGADMFHLWVLPGPLPFSLHHD